MVHGCPTMLTFGDAKLVWLKCLKGAGNGYWSVLLGSIWIHGFQIKGFCVQFNKNRRDLAIGGL